VIGQFLTFTTLITTATAHCFYCILYFCNTIN